MQEKSFAGDVRVAEPERLREVSLRAGGLFDTPAPFVFGPAGGEIAGQQMAQTFAPMRIGVVGADRLRMSEAGQRFVEVLQFDQRGAAAGECFGESWADCQRAIDVGQSLVKPAQLAQRDAAAVQRVGVIGAERQSAVVAGQCFIGAAEFAQHDAAVAVYVRNIRQRRQRAVVADQRFVVAF